MSKTSLTVLASFTVGGVGGYIFYFSRSCSQQDKYSFSFCLISPPLSIYLSICLPLSRLFYILARAPNELQPVEIPFSLISSDRARGTPGKPVELARLWAAAGTSLAPGPRFSLSLHLITLEPEIFKPMHFFYICHRCHSWAWAKEMTPTSYC